MKIEERQKVRRVVVALVKYRGKDRDMILVGKKSSDSTKFLSGRWHIPGETMNDGETDEQGLIRCLKEEAGIDKKDLMIWNSLGSHITPTGKQATWYECYSRTDKVIAGSDLEEVKWIPKRDVLSVCKEAAAYWPENIKRYFLT